jgi:MFS family permease
MTEKSRFTASAFLFVAALLTSAALIFIFGAFGLRGNSTITGGYLLVTVVSAFLLGQRKDGSFVMTSMDSVFAVFAAAITIASLLHFDKSDYKEYMLLTVNSLFAYVAGRSLSNSVLSSVRFRLLQISTPLVAAACIATVPNLIGEIYAKPFVFGFSHAATVFCIAFGYMVIAYIYSGIDWRSKISLFFFVLIVSATAVFIASTVRFVLIAIVTTALFSLACSIYKSVKIWRRVALVLLAMIFGAIIGTVSRYAFVIKISDQLANTGAFSGTVMPGQNVVNIQRQSHSAGNGPETGNPSPGDPAPREASSIGSVHSVGEPPSCNTSFDLNNSIAIRRALLGDAFFFLPKAGLFGFGLDSFSKMSCFQGHQIHNSVLQAIVEFGWVAGIALIVLIGIPLKQFLFGHQEFDFDLQFLLSCVAFATLLSLIYGQLSRDLTLFLFLGSFAKASSKSENAEGWKPSTSVSV